MKKILFISMALAAGLAFTGCSDENFVDGWKPVQTGDEINFGAKSTGVDYNMNGEKLDAPSKQSRVHYWEEMEVDGKRVFPINWDNNDTIAIYCPQASAPLPTREVNYKVIIDEGTQTNAGALAKVEMGSSGLQWGDADTHHFFAFFPKSAINGAVSKTQIKCNLPMLQRPSHMASGVDDNGNTQYMFYPKTDYMYLYAHQIIEKEQQGNTPITLKFDPLCTTLRIKVNGPNKGQDPIAVSQVEIRSSEAICGDFYLNINEDITATDGAGNKVDGSCETFNDAVQSNLITIPTLDDQGNPVSLGPGDYLIVKAFLLPFIDIEKAQTAVTVRMVGQGTKTKILTTAQIEKQKINLTSLPALVGATQSYWMTSLDPRTYVSQLSIPGTHHSYASTKYGIDLETEGNPNEVGKLMQVYQQKDLKEQFEAGARAFSVMVSKDMNVYSASAANAVQGATLISTLDALNKMLEEKIAEYDQTYPNNTGNCRDFIVVCVDYVQLLGGGDSGIPAEKLNWLHNLHKALDGWKHKDKLVSNLSWNTTINDLQKKIVLLARPQLSDYSYSTSGVATFDPNSVELYTVLRKPYTSTSWNLLDIGNDRDIKSNYLIPGEGKTVGSITDGSPDVVNSNLYYWHQALQRLQNPNTGLYPDNDDETDRIQLKIDNAKALFEQAITNNDPTNESDAGLKNWYINNLGGFCVSNDFNSYNGDWGESGNTMLAAQEINVPIYKYLVGRNVNAPIGIVLMNFLGDDTVTYSGSTQEFQGTYTTDGIKLTQMILDNNFKFPLKLNQSTQQNVRCNFDF